MRKDTNYILNAIYQGEGFNTRLDSNAVLNAVFDQSSNSLKINIGTSAVPNDGDVLKYSIAEGKWNAAPEAISAVPALASLTDVLLNDLNDGQILRYNVTTEKWENVSNLVLGNNSTAVETTYEYSAGATIETGMQMGVPLHNTVRNGSELTLTYTGQYPAYSWDTSLIPGTEIIDPSLTYRLQVVSVTSQILIVNAMSEAEAIAFAILYPTNEYLGAEAYGLCLSIETPIVVNHTNTIIVGDNIMATKDNSIILETGEIYNHSIEEEYYVGDVIEDGTNVWDMFEETGGMYIEYKGLPASFTQFNINDRIAYKEVDSTDPLNPVYSGVNYILLINDITTAAQSTSGDYIGDMTLLHCEIISGTLQEIYNNSDWKTFAATFISASTHTALNIGTGNTISHNNSHIIGNNITTDAEDTLFVNKLNVNGVSITGDKPAINELTDVSLVGTPSPADGDILIYNAVTQKWENISTASGTFTSQDNKTITVVNGVITSIV